MILIDAKKIPLTEKEAAEALIIAWKKAYSDPPTPGQLAILLSQTALETGRWRSMYNFNWGNIKASANYGGYYQMFRCNEIIKGKVEWFDPPHPQTWFRAYLKASDGASDYIAFLERPRYMAAHEALLRGSVADYTTALHTAGYFTASLSSYLGTMQKLYTEFLPKSINYLAQFKEPEPPAPLPEPEPPKPEPAPDPSPSEPPAPPQPVQPDPPSAVSPSLILQILNFIYGWVKLLLPKK